MDAKSRARGPSAGPTPGMVRPTTVFRYKQRHPLNAIFEPKSVAVVGATEKSRQCRAHYCIGGGQGVALIVER